MSAIMVVPVNETCAEVTQTDQVVPLPNGAGAATIPEDEGLWGMMGITVIASVLGLCIYSVVRYLL